MFRLFVIVWILLLIVTFTGIVSAQTVDEIIQKNLEARGGAENWQKVQTIKIQGEYTSFSTPAPFTIWRKRPDLYRFDSNRIDQDITFCYDGQRAWWLNPLFGPNFAKPKPIAMPDSMIVLRDKIFDSVLWDSRKNGYNIELLSKEKVEGKDNFKLKIALNDSTSEFWYIDCKSFLETKMEGQTFDFTRKVALQAFFNDYREVDGILLPYSVEQEYAERYRVFAVEKVKINQPIEDSIFVMPKDETK